MSSRLEALVEEYGEERALALALREHEKRSIKRKQQGKDGLLNFIREYWPVVEPARPLIEGWPLEAVCEHLEAVSHSQIKRLLLNVPPGFMKPVHVDELICTDRGFARLGDIKVGDRVLTHRGRFRSVTAVHEQGVLPLVCVETFNGRSVRSAPDHPFLTPVGWKAAGELTARDYVGIPHVAEDFGDGSMSAEEARLLGYLVGDGCISQRSLCFVSADDDVIDDFIVCATSCGFYAYVTKHSNPNMVAKKVVLKSSAERHGNGSEPPVLQWLRGHDIYLSNSYTKRIPTGVFRSGKDAIANFVGAYWSCDGMVVIRHHGAKTTMAAVATTVSEGLAGDIQRALLCLNIRSRIRRKQRELASAKQPGGIYRSFDVLTSERNEVAKIAKLPGLLGRKRVLAGMAFHDRFEAPIYEDAVLGVQVAGEGECRCLTVEEDASFTVNGLIVHNSLLTNVFWAAWEWGPMGMPWLRFIAASYSQSLTIRDNVRFRNIIMSPQYREQWGDVFSPSRDAFSVLKVANDRTGWKLATSVGGVGTGERGNRFVIDDGNSVAEAESDAVTESTKQWFTEVVPTRLNDLEQDVIINIQQRTSERDISGVILAKDLGYEHVMIPMEYDSARHCRTSIGWSDPRTVDGELAWPARFSPKAVAELKRVLGPYAVAGQLMQTPEVRGGGIFKRDWWNLWESPDGKFPQLEFVLASLDTAYTEKQENDPSAFTVWGVFRDKANNSKVVLMHAWQKRLELHGPEVPRLPGESTAAYVRRASPEWGLVEWVAHTCRRFKIDRLLIEAKASGITVAQEIKRLYANEGWGVMLIDPKSQDKVARAYAVQHLFADGYVYAPEREWANMVIDQMAAFPKAAHDDLTDTATQALKHLRDIGFAIRREERAAADEAMATHKAQPTALYPI